MNIQKLQRAIVDGLAQTKAHNIRVFNTEHLSALFERVIIASGTSNRQTRALASSVRDAVKAGGMQVMRTEGEANGEWIIVDCGAAVAHIMQPAVRDYYHLEEIWGEKPVHMKIDGNPRGLPKASEPAAGNGAAAARQQSAAEQAVAVARAKTSAAKQAPATKSAVRKTAAKKAPAAGPATKKTASRKSPATKAVSKPAAARKASSRSRPTVLRTEGFKTAAKKAPARKPAAPMAASKSPGRRR
jgi:ribosome-associated protein